MTKGSRDPGEGAPPGNKTPTAAVPLAESRQTLVLAIRVTPYMPQVAQYHLASRWSFSAPVGAVWAELSRPELWPTWWKGVQAVRLLAHGEGGGMGAYRRITWRGLLFNLLFPSVTFNQRTVKIEPRAMIESVADGQLTGIGRWQLTRAGAVTEVEHDWIVNVNVPAVPILAGLTGMMFKWRYHSLMEAGRRGLESRVGVRLT